MIETIKRARVIPAGSGIIFMDDDHRYNVYYTLLKIYNEYTTVIIFFQVLDILHFKNHQILNHIMQSVYVALSVFEDMQNPIFNSHMHSFFFLRINYEQDFNSHLQKSGTKSQRFLIKS